MRLLICVLTVLHKFGKLLANICSNIFSVLAPFFRTPSTHILNHLKVSYSWLFKLILWFILFLILFTPKISFWRVYITMPSNSLIFFVCLFSWSCLLILIPMSYLGFIFQFLCIPYKFWFNVIHCKLNTAGIWISLYS